MTPGGRRRRRMAASPPPPPPPGSIVNSVLRFMENKNWDRAVESLETAVQHYYYGTIASETTFSSSLAAATGKKKKKKNEEEREDHDNDGEAEEEEQDEFMDEYCVNDGNADLIRPVDSFVARNEMRGPATTHAPLDARTVDVFEDNDKEEEAAEEDDEEKQDMDDGQVVVVGRRRGQSWSLVVVKKMLAPWVSMTRRREKKKKAAPRRRPKLSKRQRRLLAMECIDLLEVAIRERAPASVVRAILELHPYASTEEEEEEEGEEEEDTSPLLTKVRATKQLSIRSSQRTSFRQSSTKSGGHRRRGSHRRRNVDILNAFIRACRTGVDDDEVLALLLQGAGSDGTAVAKYAGNGSLGNFHDHGSGGGGGRRWIRIPQRCRLSMERLFLLQWDRTTPLVALMDNLARRQRLRSYGLYNNRNNPHLRHRFITTANDDAFVTVVPYAQHTPARTTTNRNNADGHDSDETDAFASGADEDEAEDNTGTAGATATTTTPTPDATLSSVGSNGREMVEFLVKANPAAIAIRDCCGKNVIHRACRSMVDVEVLKLLLDHYPGGKNGAAIPSVRSVHSRWGDRTESEYLPLHLACGLGQRRPDPATVRLLIQAYPEAVQMRSNYGDFLPIHVLCFRRRRHGSPSFEPWTDHDDKMVTLVLKELLQCHPDGANAWTRGYWAGLPLHLALRSGASVDVVETLLQSHPEAVYKEDPQAVVGTPFHSMCMYSNEANLQVVKMMTRRFPDLLRRPLPARLNTHGNVVQDGLLPLHLIVRSNAFYFGSRHGAAAANGAQNSSKEELVREILLAFPAAAGAREGRLGNVPVRYLWRRHFLLYEDWGDDLMPSSLENLAAPMAAEWMPVVPAAEWVADARAHRARHFMSTFNAALWKLLLSTYPESMYLRDFVGRCLLDNMKESWIGRFLTYAYPCGFNHSDLATARIRQQMRQGSWNDSDPQKETGNLLPIHVACENLAPVSVISLLHRASPESFRVPTPHGGNLPLHLACLAETPRRATVTPTIASIVRSELDEMVKAMGVDGATAASDQDGMWKVVHKLIELDGSALAVANREGHLPFALACLNSTRDNATVSVLYEVLRAYPVAVLGLVTRQGTRDTEEDPQERQRLMSC